MKKTLAMLGVSALALMGCDSRDANAQSQVSADVGNADSANMLIVEEAGMMKMQIVKIGFGGRK